MQRGNAGDQYIALLRQAPVGLGEVRLWDRRDLIERIQQGASELTAGWHFAVHVHHEVAEPYLLEVARHCIDGRTLFGDEKDAFPVRDEGRDQVANGL